MNSLSKWIVLVYLAGVSAMIGAQLLGFSVLSLSTLEVALAAFASAGVLLTAIADYKPRHLSYPLLAKDVLEASLRQSFRSTTVPEPEKAVSHR
jgi:hypothetical protein